MLRFHQIWLDPDGSLEVGGVSGRLGVVGVGGWGGVSGQTGRGRVYIDRLQCGTPIDV